MEAKGEPLRTVVAGANLPDTKLLERTLEAIGIERPIPTEQKPQQRCLDQGYANPTVREAVRKHGAAPQFRRSGAEKLGTAGEKRRPAPQWVVDGGWWSVPWAGGRNASLAGALGQEGWQLSGAAPVGLWAIVAPSPVAPHPPGKRRSFVIVS